AIAELPDIKLTVFTCVKSEPDRKWEVQNKFPFATRCLSGFSFNLPGHNVYIKPELIRIPKREKFDVVVCGSFEVFSMTLAFISAYYHGVPFVLWSEIIKESRTLFGKYLRKLIIGKSTSFFASGKLATEYLINMGADADKIFIGGDVVDNDFFSANSRMTMAEKTSMKDSFGISQSKIVLFCGQFIKRKRPVDLLVAFSIVKQQFKDAALVFLGYGPMENLIRKESAACNISDSVYIIPFQKYEDLPRYYTFADMLVIPSDYEPWGLVINEAMACGLPVVAADAVGAAADLVHEGVNGNVVPTGNIQALAGSILKLLSDKDLLQKMGNASRDIIKKWNFKNSADSFAEACKAAKRKLL
ncbi:MAG: glycosyltransferase, partial [Planctomycetota bacterium]